MTAQTKVAEVGRSTSTTTERFLALGLVLGLGFSILAWLWWLLE